MRTIELSIKKRMKRMNLTALLLGGVCLLCQPLQAQQSIDACDGRTYKVGDTLRIGEPLLSGYLFVKQLNANNQFDKLNPKTQPDGLPSLPTYLLTSPNSINSSAFTNSRKRPK